MKNVAICVDMVVAMQRNKAALLEADHAQKLQLATDAKESIQTELGKAIRRNQTIVANNLTLQQNNAELKVSECAM